MTTKKISFDTELLCQKLNKTLKVSQIFSLSLVFFLILNIFSCNQVSQNNTPKYSDTITSSTIPVYHFAIHPLHNPSKLMKDYQPLIDYLNQNVHGAQFVLEASKSYSSFEQKYNSRRVQFILPNPWQTIQAINAGYNVIIMAGDPTDFKGIFIVRKDANISKPSDLIGKKISYPAATALAACIMPQYFLYKNGININKDITNLYVGSQESSIMNVYLKETIAGATWPPPWRAFLKEHPQEASQLKIIWETESLINNSVMA
ncbi:MAG: phosphate/phosphite/phosphonate ABC transporter substrate-binding protein, partial [Bacteroidota bacterium]|nr:phosphate/phosphite/phosphonate ABC transporter substrate-binding protein [Bacteroidota bacterium]